MYWVRYFSAAAAAGGREAPCLALAARVVMIARAVVNKGSASLAGA